MRFAHFRPRARITSGFRISAAPTPTPAAAGAGPYLRLDLNLEILNVGKATPPISLNWTNRICSTSGREFPEPIVTLHALGRVVASEMAVARRE